MNIRCWLLSLVLICVSISAARAVNPYGVAGYGVLSQLGMPSGALDYDWNYLREDSALEMGHWDVGDHRWHHYDPATDQIIDVPRFRQWVIDHPGKIWLLGNEPNAQGITPAVYARMFHRYYEEIHPRDPSAKFAIAALTGGFTSADFTTHSDWFAQALNEYKTQFGVIMPIDIWNIHQYNYPAYIEDPDKPINDYVKPFITWCHAAEAGAYSGAPVWITEMPLATWSNALSEEYTVWFMQRYLTRLEQSGISRFFWFVSSDWDLKEGSCGLVRSGQVTTVGAAYAALANSYPNAIVPVEPFVPPPGPGYTAFDFSGPLASPWTIKGGNWIIDNGALRHSPGVYFAWGTSCVLVYDYADTGVTFKMKINSAPDPTYWGGVIVRSASRFQTGETGYLLLVRQNGEMVLYTQADGAVVSLPGAVADPQNYHDYRLLISGYNIMVWLDGALKINWADPNARFAHGHVMAIAAKSDVSFDDFHVVKYTGAPLAVTDDGVYTTDLSHLHAAWSAADPGSGFSGYQYAVGTSPSGGTGETSVIDWTYTTETSLNVPLTLTPGTRYYVSVKAVYPDGFESITASSDGITAAIGCATIRQAKSLPGSSFIVVAGKVVSGVSPGWVYVQEPSGIGGIRANGTLALQAGDVVTLMGRTGIDGQEAVLTSPSVVDVAHGTPPIPLLMNNRAAGGSAMGLQPAAVDHAGSPNVPATGLSPIGALVKTTGKVTYVDQPAENYIYVDDGSKLTDGSGHAGMRVSLAYGPLPAVGANAALTGCLGATDVGGNCVRYLRPRSAGDVSYDQVLSCLRNAGFERGSYPPWVYTGTGGGIRSGAWTAGVRAHSGSKFFGASIYNSMCSGTLVQTVSLPAGVYRASVWSWVYHSYNDPMAAASRIGIDPTGGTDPNSPNVSWSAWDTQSRTVATDWREISTPSATVATGVCTVFLQYSQQFISYYNINLFDDATLVSVP